MGKQVKVYNAIFGDCVMLEDNSSFGQSSNLLVDFGIKRDSVIPKIYVSRKHLTQMIADDIVSSYSNYKNKPSLLITHFHEDHVSGLVFMYNKSIYRRMFDRIYIPNIWGNPFSVVSFLIEEIFLKSEMKRCGLPGTSASLFDVLLFLTDYIRKVTLLKRKDTFEDGRYIALWPDVSVDKDLFRSVFNELRIPDGLVSELERISISLCELVINGIVEGQGESLSLANTINEYRAEFVSLCDNYSPGYFNEIDPDKLIFYKRKLNKLNHKYNIVFQNTYSDGENVLFTGDAERDQMTAIAKATDIELYDSYKYIKIPHHGTESHFFDFYEYCPENVIITNGRYKSDKKGVSKISNRYGLLPAIHICSNSNHCENCTYSCPTSIYPCKTGRCLVYSNLYFKK